MNESNQKIPNTGPRFFRALRLRVGKKRAASLDDTVLSLDSSKSRDSAISRIREHQRHLLIPSSATNSFGGPDQNGLASNMKDDVCKVPQGNRGEVHLDYPCSTQGKNDQQCESLGSNNDVPFTVMEIEHGREDPVYQDIKLRSRLEALRAQQSLLGEGHPDVLFSLQGLCSIHCKRGEYRQAQRVFDEACRRSTLSQDNGPPREIVLHMACAEQQQHYAL